MVHQLAELSDACAATGNPPLIVDVDQMAARVTLDVIGLVISRVINPLRAVFPGKFHSGKKGEV
ncbi:hypothetical protein HaLaN_13269 [Haematococcus lacustris]|uniref:Uncharacterized protein n=1 Tax=Haematococcus lacustris TaxID=44745 RepID=A0A699ZCN8_HAELA|nr:hypothetical protein HaLaN_13269 [Haematococcus lacustris]